MKRITSLLPIILILVVLIGAQWKPIGGVSVDSVGTAELNDQSDIPATGECVRVDSSDATKIEYTACPGAAGGDSITVDGGAVVDPDFDDGGDINFTNTANVITADVKANSVALTTDTTGNYAAGDAEAGAALTGDSATSFFSSGSIEDARVPDSITIDLSTLATTLTITDNESTAETNAVLFTAGGDLDGGNLGIESDGTLNYTPSTGILDATDFTEGGIAVLNNDEIDASSELAVIMDDETGSGVLVFGTAPTFTTSISFNAVTDTVGGIQNQNLLDKTAAETLTGDWVNTANPWADNEVVDTLTASNYLLLTGGTLTGDTFVSDLNGLVIGHTSQINVGTIPEFQVLGTGVADASSLIAQFSANTNGPSLRFLKSRNASIGGNTILLDGDQIGRIRFQAADGGDFNTTGAEITAVIDGTPGLNDMPTRLMFFTTLDGASSPTERMRITNDGKIGINQSSPSHTLDIVGDFELSHTATNNDDHGLELIIDAAGFGDVKGIDIDYITGAISAGEDEEAILVNIDESLSTGGRIAGIEVLTTTIGSAVVTGLEAGVGVGPILQESGAFENLTFCEVFRDTEADFTDCVTAANSTGTDVQLWVSDDDIVYIGFATQFEEIEWIFDTVSGNPGLQPVFEFSISGPGWTAFSPVDGTNGARNNGIMAWERDDLSNWVAVAVDSDSAFWIRITRTANAVTGPTEDLIKIADPINFSWDKDGSLLVKDISFEGTDDAFETTISATDPTADRSFTLPDDELASGDLMVGSGAGTFVYTAKGSINLSDFNDDLTHTTDTGPSPDCSGTTTYQDGEGGCDDLSAVYQPLDSELTTIAGLTETNGNVMFVAGGAWTSDATPAIDCTDCTNIPAGSHTGTITWGGTSILESGVAFQFGDGTDATLTHTWANSGTDVTVAYSSALFTFSHGLTLSAGNITQAAGTTLFMGGLLDAVGDVDMDYGSADIDDHTFITDGTGTAEIVFPAGAIDGTEILDDTIDSDDYAAASIDLEHMASASVDSDNIVDNTIANADMADNSIDSDDYVDASIDLAHMSSDSVDSDNIVDATIVSADAVAEEFVEPGKNTLWIPAAAMRPTVSNGAAALADIETTAARPDVTALAFDDEADEHVQFQAAFPKSWNLGTVTFQVFWTSTATDTDGVSWGAQGVCMADNETIDVAYGTPVVVDDANQSAVEELYVSAESGAVTFNGTPADNDLCYMRVFRDISDSNDTATEDALLLGIKLFYTTDLSNDD